MKRGFGGTVVLFLLWCFVYFAIYVIGNIVVDITTIHFFFIDLSGQNNVVCLFILVGSLMVIALGLWWFAKKIAA